jgi:ferredoxin
MQQTHRQYRIQINREKCIGDGLCREEADATFEIDKSLRCAVKDAQGNSPEDILFAAWNCPNGCITLFDADTGRKVFPGKLTRAEFDEIARRKAAEMEPEEWSFWRDIGVGD